MISNSLSRASCFLDLYAQNFRWERYFRDTCYSKKSIKFFIHTSYFSDFPYQKRKAIMKILTTFLKTMQAIGASTPPVSLPPCWLLSLHSPLVFSLTWQPLGNWSLNSFLNSSLHQTCCIFKKNGQNKLFYFHMGYPSPPHPLFFLKHNACALTKASFLR